jgi:hypothetical protein
MAVENYKWGKLVGAIARIGVLRNRRANNEVA